MTAVEIRTGSPVSFGDIQQAAEVARPVARRTPVMTSATLDAQARTAVHLKCENFQKGGAFKIRGAANFILPLSPERLRNGVVAYSSGNHAQAVAIAARHAGVPATIVMPDDAPKVKREATGAYGARIVTYDRLRESREEIGEKIAGDSGAVLVPPYDHPSIIAGQGASALELLEDVPDLDSLVAPIGGGGLLSGCAICARAMQPGIRIFGVEPEDANDTYLSLQRGERISIPPPATIADGLRAAQPGAITFPILQRHLESVILVSDDEIREAVLFLLTRMKIVVEPSGAASVAAVLFRRLPPEIRNVGVIVSGGNLDLEAFSK